MTTYEQNIAFLLSRNPGEDLFCNNEKFEKDIHVSCWNKWFHCESNDKNHAERQVNRVAETYFQSLVDSGELSQTSPTYRAVQLKATTFLSKIEDIADKRMQFRFRELINSPETLEARLAIAAGIAPTPLNKTSSGTYILYNRKRQELGIFKPAEQEVGGNKNPSWFIYFVGSTDHLGIKATTAYSREKAAYVLDDGFAGVPHTTTTHFAHINFDTSFFSRKTRDWVGSFQLFKQNCKPIHETLKTDDYINSKNTTLIEARSQFAMDWPLTAYLIYLFESTVIVPMKELFFKIALYLKIKKLSVSDDQIRKIAIFDIRTLNCDRHLANILFDVKSKTAIPIDHGWILPGNANNIRFEWMQLRQSKKAFSKAELEYIKKLDPEKDAEKLRELGIESGAINRMIIATKLLQKCAKKGLTAYDIGEIMTRSTKKVEVNTFASLFAEKTSYFEDYICKRIITGSENVDKVLDEVIRKYASWF